MIGGHYQLNGRELEQTLGDSGGQGSLACCSPWGRKESDMTQRLNNNNYTSYNSINGLKFYFFSRMVLGDTSRVDGIYFSQLTLP